MLPTNMLAGNNVTADALAAISRAVIAGTNLEILNAFGTASLSTTSTSFANVTGGSLSFTKEYDDSDILGIVLLSAYNTSAGQLGTWGISDGTTDHTITQFLHTNANRHLAVFGWDLISGLAAGSYTMQLRAKTAGGTLTIDANDTVCMVLAELMA